MKKYMFGIFAIVLAVGFTAFTTVKSDNNASVQTPLYWYEVHPGSQVILQGTQLFAYDERANVESFCPSGDQIDCLRGFTEAQNTESGPVTDTGIEQIETDE